MGLSFMSKCKTNYVPESAAAPAPNPDPKRWELLSTRTFKNAYVLVVQYLDATNFEGIKVMVYKGKIPRVWPPKQLDPHFSERRQSPIARFRPDNEGLQLAFDLARRL